DSEQEAVIGKRNWLPIECACQRQHDGINTWASNRQGGFIFQADSDINIFSGTIPRCHSRWEYRGAIIGKIPVRKLLLSRFGICDLRAATSRNLEVFQCAHSVVGNFHPDVEA